MSNKHSQGPRCPMCPKTFRTPEQLNDHQHSKCHFPHIRERTEEDRARIELQRYHQDKMAGKT